MARNYRGIISFLLLTLVGILAGAILGTLTRGLLLKLTPPRFEAVSVLFHTPGSGMSDSGRDFLAATLAQPDFLPSVATRHGWDATMAAGIASKVSVGATDASGPIAEIRLAGTDPTALANTLHAIAEQMVELHRDKQEARLQWQLSELDEVLETAIRRERELKAEREDDASLPPSVHNTIVAATDLARQRRELELAARYRLRPESAFDTAKRQRRLNDVLAKQQRLKLSSGDNTNVESAEFATEQAVALATAELLALQQTQERLKREFKSFRPLQIVQRAKLTPLTVAYIPTQILAGVGSLIGALVGALVWTKRRSSTGGMSDSGEQGSLRTPRCWV